MVEITGLKLAPSAAMKEKRLAVLLAGRDAAADPALAEALVSAQVRGSLELAGRSGTPEEEEAAAALRRAISAVDPRAPLTVEAIQTWQEALTGARALRAQDRDRTGGPPPAPARVRRLATRDRAGMAGWRQRAGAHGRAAGRARLRAHHGDPAFRSRQRPRGAPGRVTPDDESGIAPADPRRRGQRGGWKKRFRPRSSSRPSRWRGCSTRRPSARSTS